MANPLTIKQMTQNITVKQLMQFEQLVHDEEWEQVIAWHKQNTPWCSKEVIEEYLETYKKLVNVIKRE